LLLTRQVGKSLAVSRNTNSIYLCDPPAIIVLPFPEKPTQLQVNVIHHAGRNGAGILIFGNDPAANSPEGSGFIVRKKTPRTPNMPTRNARASGNSSCCGLDEFSPIDLTSFSHV
jgi:hypothetical protein